ncbi:MAG TPA: molybdopterin-binding protein [Pirellulaceae bacterium]
MPGELLAFGDELIRGQRINTNSAWLSRALSDLGIEARTHTLVGDDLPESVAALRAAAERSEVVVCTGGLGPTADDLVREALAEAFSCPLEFDPQVLDDIREIFRRRGRDMPELNRRQAYFPRGSRSIANPFGTAPGIELEVREGQTVVYALPGVPSEMEEMWPQVAARLRHRGASTGAIRHRVLKCFGVGESHLEALIPEFTVRDRNPLVGITVHDATIALRITARDPREEVCEELLDDTEQGLRHRLGDFVFGTGEDELEHAVERRFAQAKCTLGLVEIAAPATLSGWLRRVPSSRPWFVGGLVIDDLSSLSRMWPLDGVNLRGGPEPFVQSLAQSLRSGWETDVALVWGKLQAGGPDEDVQVGIASDSQCVVHSYAVQGHPLVKGPRAGKMALDLLRKFLDHAVPVPTS